MISPRTVSAMKNMIVKYPLNVISLNPIGKKLKKTNRKPGVWDRLKNK